jgi:hypothetical protein
MAQLDGNSQIYRPKAGFTTRESQRDELRAIECIVIDIHHYERQTIDCVQSKHG